MTNPLDLQELPEEEAPKQQPGVDCCVCSIINN